MQVEYHKETLKLWTGTRLLEKSLQQATAANYLIVLLCINSVYLNLVAITFCYQNLGKGGNLTVILLLQNQSHNIFFCPKIYDSELKDTWTNPLWNCFPFVYIFSFSWIAADNQDRAGKLHAAQALTSNTLEQIVATVVLIRHRMNKMQLN